MLIISFNVCANRRTRQSFARAAKLNKWQLQPRHRSLVSFICIQTFSSNQVWAIGQYRNKKNALEERSWKKIKLIAFSNLFVSKHPVTRVEFLTSVTKTANVTIVFVFYICVCDWEREYGRVRERESYSKRTFLRTHARTHQHTEKSFTHLISSLTGFCWETFGSPEDANWRPSFCCCCLVADIRKPWAFQQT